MVQDSHPHQAKQPKLIEQDDEIVEETKVPIIPVKKTSGNDWDNPLDLFSAPKPIKKIPKDKKINQENRDSKKPDQLETIEIEQKPAPKQQNVPKLTEEQTQDLIKESDEYKMWKNIPKAQRERLTKKQMMRVMKPDILAEGLAFQVNEQKSAPKKVIQSASIEENSSQQKSIVEQKPKQVGVTAASQLPQKHFREEQAIKQREKLPIHPPTNNDTFKQKTKPRKIVVEERNENNEIVRQIVEKSRKHKVTAIKKAILKKRESLVQKANRQLESQQTKKGGDDGLSSGYVTIDEAHENGEIPKHQIEKPKDTLLIKTKGLPYTAIFRDLDTIYDQCEEELLRPIIQKLEQHQQTLTDSKKPYVRFEMENNANDGDEAIQNSSLHFHLHPKRYIREYVDMVQNFELEQDVFALVQKLKKLYFNRKINPNNKKGKQARNLKKRYIVGMKQVIKHLNAENLKMIVVSVNIERVEGENGLDGFIYDIIQGCRDQKVPLVFCLTRYKLGYVSKFQGQQASILGVFNFQGANEEFSALVSKAKELREEFYRQMCKNLDEYQVKLLRKENRFLDWQLFDRTKETIVSGNAPGFYV